MPIWNCKGCCGQYDKIPRPEGSGIVAYARLKELQDDNGEIDYKKVAHIANETINIVRDTVASTQNIDEVIQ